MTGDGTRLTLVTGLPEPIGPTPRLRGWLHLLAFVATVVVGENWIAGVAPAERPVDAVYLVALAGLLGTSAAYHVGRWGPAAHRRWQRADHAMIFIFIASSMTPLAWLTMPHGSARTLLVVIWLATAIAVIVHLTWMDAPELVVGFTFVALGCSGVAVLPSVLTHSGVVTASQVLAGGILYICGAVLYHRRRPDPWPNSFGYHEVFHVFVCVAAALQWWAIAGMRA